MPTTLRVRRYRGKPKETTEGVDFPSTNTVKDVKIALLKRYSKSLPTHVLAGVHNCAVLKLTFPDGTDMVLTDNSLTVGEMSALPSFSGAVLDFKNVGAQINYRLVFVLEYLGPILLMALFYSRPSFIYGAGASSEPYSSVASTGALLWCLHFVKRELETFFVHKFSRETMPLQNLFKNCAHYWLAAVYVGWPLCSPQFSGGGVAAYALIPAFAASQWINFAAHRYFSLVRKSDGDQRRPMPTGPLFTFVYVVVVAVVVV